MLLCCISNGMECPRPIPKTSHKNFSQITTHFGRQCLPRETHKKQLKPAIQIWKCCKHNLVCYPTSALTIGMPRKVTKLADPSLNKLCRYTSETEAAILSHHSQAAPAVDVANVIDRQYPSTSYSYRLLLLAVEQNRAHYCLVYHLLCRQRICLSHLLSLQAERRLALFHNNLPISVAIPL